MTGFGSLVSGARTPSAAAMRPVALLVLGGMGWKILFFPPATHLSGAWTSLSPRVEDSE